LEEAVVPKDIYLPQILYSTALDEGIETFYCQLSLQGHAYDLCMSENAKKFISVITIWYTV
jgi:hypothetical protein